MGARAAPASGATIRTGISWSCGNRAEAPDRRLPTLWSRYPLMEADMEKCGGQPLSTTRMQRLAIASRRIQRLPDELQRVAVRITHVEDEGYGPVLKVLDPDGTTFVVPHD